MLMYESRNPLRPKVTAPKKAEAAAVSWIEEADTSPPVRAENERSDEKRKRGDSWEAGEASERVECLKLGIRSERAGHHR